MCCLFVPCFLWVSLPCLLSLSRLLMCTHDFWFELTFCARVHATCQMAIGRESFLRAPPRNKPYPPEPEKSYWINTAAASRPAGVWVDVRVCWRPRRNLGALLQPSTTDSRHKRSALYPSHPPWRRRWRHSCRPSGSALGAARTLAVDPSPDLPCCSTPGRRRTSTYGPFSPLPSPVSLYPGLLTFLDRRGLSILHVLGRWRTRDWSFPLTNVQVWTFWSFMMPGSGATGARSSATRVSNWTGRRWNPRMSWRSTSLCLRTLDCSLDTCSCQLLSRHLNIW